MKGFIVVKPYFESPRLNVLINKLKKSLDKETLDNIYGGITFGSFAKNTFWEQSDLDALLIYKIPLQSLVLYGYDRQRPEFSVGFTAETNPAYTTQIIDGEKFEIGLLPITNTHGREGLIDQAVNNKIHDMLNIVYGVPLDIGKHVDWLQRFRDMLLQKFNWSEADLINHGAGMGKSQIKKAESNLRQGTMGTIRYLKLITTSFYISMNTYNLLTHQIWYGSYFDCVEKASEVLGDAESLFFDMGKALQLRDETLSKFTNVIFERSLQSLDKVVELLHGLTVHPLQQFQKDENQQLLNNYLKELYFKTIDCKVKVE
jgi:predicted nucleotidyltransferase